MGGFFVLDHVMNDFLANALPLLVLVFVVLGFCLPDRRFAASGRPGGYGGWLIALSLSLVLSALTTVGNAYEIGPFGPGQIPLAWAAGLLFFSAIVALRRFYDKRTVWWALAVLWLAGPGYYLASMMLWSQHDAQAYALQSHQQGLMHHLVHAVVWSLYLTQSRRVALTYSPAAQTAQ